MIKRMTDTVPAAYLCRDSMYRSQLDPTLTLLLPDLAYHVSEGIKHVSLEQEARVDNTLRMNVLLSLWQREDQLSVSSTRMSP